MKHLLPCLALLLGWASPNVQASERFDHRGAVGLLLAPGVAHRSAIAGARLEDGPRLNLDLGGTWAIGYNGNELLLFGRAGLGRGAIDWSLTGGYRGYFGADRIKTFVDLDAAVHLAPAWTIGPRLGFGVQYELSPVAGLFAGVGTQIGFGEWIRFDAELMLGLQFRSYLLE